EVGHGLAGMSCVRKRIDHRNRSVSRQFFDGRMSKRSHCHCVDILAQDPGEIGDALTDPKADILASQEDRVATQACDRRLEAYTSAQRRFFEQKSERAARQRQRPLSWPVVVLEP